MKKRLFLFVLLYFCQAGAASAEYTNDTSGILSQYRTNEEYMKNGQALTAIGADKAYTGTDRSAYTGFSGNGVTVALISSGVGLRHEDLKNKILNAGFNETDDFGWGSEMAGIIAAEKNGLGLHGVAYNASLLPFNQSLNEENIFTALSDTYDSFKIINSYSILPVLYAAEHFPNWGKDRLFVAAWGNSSRSPYPSLSSVLKNNVINVVSYDAAKTPDDDHFIHDANDLAIGAQKWTLAAPATFYTSDTDNNDQQTKYVTASLDILAGSAVAGAAALVQEAFPQMDGRQIADMLFLSALRKDELTLSPYMIQEHASAGGNVKRFLFFTDQNEMEYDAALAEAIAAGKWTACSPGSETCLEERVTFEDVFGQGLLNVGEAVKGPRYLNAVRSDYDSAAGQFFHTVTVPDAELNWTWSNDIAQIVITDPESEYKDKTFGIKKQGAGSLTLSGDNTFSGKSVVKEGTLILTGHLASPVTVEGGTFYLGGGTLTGNIVVNSGEAVINSGTVIGGVTTSAAGQFKMEAGTVTGDMTNTGTFNVTGNALFRGTINNKTTGKTVVASEKTLTVTEGRIENHGEIKGYGTINGIVTNAADGTIGTSLTIDGTLNSTGTILLERNGSIPKTMSVGTLNITGGKLVLSEENLTLRRGETYTAITYGTLEAFNDFESHRLSDFVVAVPVLAPEEKRLNVFIDFQPLPEEEINNSFSENERKTLKAVNNICTKQNRAACERFYFYTTDDMKKQMDTLRSKVLPVQNEQLPLTKVMASQVHAHLFTNSIVQNASEVWNPNGRLHYHRGRSGGDTMRYGKGSRYNVLPHQNKVWGQVLGGTFKEDGDSSLNRKELTTRSVGAMFGYDHEFSDKFMLGFLAGTSSAKITEDKNEIKLRDYRIGLYTASRFGQVTFNTVLTGGFQKYDSERTLTVFGEKETGIAKYNGYSAEFDINLGYDFMRLPYRDYSFFLRSYLSANVNYLYQDAYKEKGDSFLALGVNSMHNTSVSVSPGITLGYNFYVFSETVLTADFSYERLVSGARTNASAYFLADTEKAVIPMQSVDTDKEFFNAGLGLKIKLNRNWQMHLWAGTRTSKRTEALNFAATFSYYF